MVFLPKVKSKSFLAFLLLLFLTFSVSSPVSAADTLYFLHTDHLGSTRVVTDKTGTVVAKYDYYPYGAISYQLPPFAEASGGGPTTNSLPTERLYTSQIFDQDSDLYFYNARYYNPAIGNFISADTADGSYLYTGGNPINSTDPSGNFVEGGGGNVYKPNNNPTGVLGWFARLFLPQSEAEFKSRQAYYAYSTGAVALSIIAADMGPGAPGAIMGLTGILPPGQSTLAGEAGPGISTENDFDQPVTYKSGARSTYTSSGGQELVIDERSDPNLRRALIKGEQQVQKMLTENPGMSKERAVAQYVESLPYNQDIQQSIYRKGGGIARLGDFFKKGFLGIGKGAAVCREKAFFADLLLGDSRTSVVVGNLRGGRHAWIEKTGIVIDPTSGWVGDATGYYSSQGVDRWSVGVHRVR